MIKMKLPQQFNKVPSFLAKKMVDGAFTIGFGVLGAKIRADHFEQDPGLAFGPNTESPSQPFEESEGSEHIGISEPESISGIDQLSPMPIEPEGAQFSDLAIAFTISGFIGLLIIILIRSTLFKSSSELE